MAPPWLTPRNKEPIWHWSNRHIWLILAELIVIIAVVALLCVGAARASGADVLRDCAADGKLNRSYTRVELQQALTQMPADVAQYTDCVDVIHLALIEPTIVTTQAKPTFRLGTYGASFSATRFVSFYYKSYKLGTNRSYSVHLLSRRTANVTVRWTYKHHRYRRVIYIVKLDRRQTQARLAS